ITCITLPLFLPASSSLEFFLYYCTYVQYSQAYFPSPPSPRCCPEEARMAPALATYEPRDPSRTVLYHVIADHLETFLAALDADRGPKELLLPFSCKRRGFCPSCAARRMAQTAAHLVTCVIPWVPTRQWVVSVPIPLRYWMAASQALTAQVHTIIRTTIGQYYVHKAVTRGCERATIHPGSVTFIQRFGSAINLNLHFHCVFLEGVYLDRTDQVRMPR